MGQIFHPSTNTISKVSIFGAAFIVAAAFWVGLRFYRSDYVTRVRVVRLQPVQFSHKHHVGGLGIDCRFCHNSVEDSPFAGLPETQTCMHCHSQIWSDSPYLAIVRDSFRTGRSIHWVRVHQIADFAYFDHSIHVAKGIGCTECHGAVGQMDLMWREKSLFMEWCLECHRAPERFVRPKEFVFSPDWQAPAHREELGRKLVAEYKIAKFTSCSNCHH